MNIKISLSQTDYAQKLKKLLKAKNITEKDLHADFKNVVDNVGTLSMLFSESGCSKETNAKPVPDIPSSGNTLGQPYFMQHIIPSASNIKLPSHYQIGDRVNLHFGTQLGDTEPSPNVYECVICSVKFEANYNCYDMYVPSSYSNNGDGTYSPIYIKLTNIPADLITNKLAALDKPQ